MTDRFLGTHVSTSGGVAQGPLRAKEIPCNTIQIFAKNNNQWLAKKDLSTEEIDAFLKNKESCGIHISFSHAGYLINLASPDPKNHELSLRSTTQELERARQLDLDFVVLHPGAHVGTRLEAGIKKIAESINRILDTTEMGRTLLLLETTAGQGSCVGGKFEELAEIFERVENKTKIGICLDTCHVFAAGYDLRDAISYESMWKQFDASLGRDNLKALHLNDSKGACGSKLDRHEHIGAGQIGDAGFTLLMRDSRLQNIPMVLETPKHEDYILHDRKNIQKLLSFL